jgi:hypothetical protein
VGILKSRRGDLSGPVLAILVTLVLLAIGAAIIAYFVLLGGAPQQPVIAVLGQPVIMKAVVVAGGPGIDFIANITIKNVGSSNVSLQIGPDPPSNVFLNITGKMAKLNYTSKTSLAPGETATLGFVVEDAWARVAGKEIVHGVLIVRDVGTLEISFRVIRPS